MEPYSPRPTLVIDHVVDNDEARITSRALASPFQLNEQEHAFVLQSVTGKPFEDICYAIGLPRDTDIASRPHVQQALEYMRQKQSELSNFTREQATEMFLQAFHCADTAGEMVQATRELANLHDLYPAKKSIGVRATVPVKRANKLTAMKDEELLEALDISLTPEADDGEPDA